MGASSDKGHRAAAAGGAAASLRAVLDDIAARLAALESADASGQAGDKSERGKIKASVARLTERVEALETAGGE